jgi:hypothetical protein
VTTEDKRIACRGSGGDVNISQSNDLALLNAFNKALDPFTDKILEAYKKQQAKRRFI